MGYFSERKDKLIQKKMSRLIDSWGLNYNFGSIYYILNFEGVSLEQCATCVFEGDSIESIDIHKNIEEATRILLIAGHVKYGDMDYDEENKLAFSRMDTWRKRFGNISLLHMTLISVLKHRDFFSERLLDTVEVASGLAKMYQLKMIRCEHQKSS